ncbi:MAG: hypothetical protein LUQ51_05330 [Methanothrix sp.]|nr:hypothetical protein [Methanothrix sp.]MDD1741382.1 hypothetical protein [Methanothrix sp.]OYV11265.1 MAG: hypothetical protein CG446_819 [Methanosaeta sp. ASO1]
MSEQKREAKEAIEESFFTTAAFQALTIGLPFCAFKMLFGLLCWRIGLEQAYLPLASLGGLVMVWATVDLFMNLARVFFQLAGRPSPIEYCIVAQAGRLIGRPRLFLALDTLASFSIICIVLWSGWISFLSRQESWIWIAATTLNLISVSFVNIWMELRRGK